MDDLARTVVAFWFADALRSADAAAARMDLWFSANADFDREIRDRFASLPERALAGEFDAWTLEAESALALVLVLDQFPRNLFRGDARAFAFDAKALEVASSAVAAGFGGALAPLQASFLYLPFEHSERLGDQERSVELFEQLIRRAPPELVASFEQSADYARRHRDVIRRFGRFPHRNSIMGRRSTAEELAYLEAGGETFGTDSAADGG